MAKVNPAIIEESKLKHYKAEVMIPQCDRDILLPSNLEELVTGKLLSELEPVIKDSIVGEEDRYLMGTRYSVDIWVR